MALPRFLYSVTESSPAPLLPQKQQELEGTLRSVDDPPAVVASRSAGTQEEGLELEQRFTNPNTTTKKAISNGVSLSGGSERSSRGSSGKFTSSVDTVASGDYVLYKNDERTKWEEAALYVHEGEDNNKFYHHPAGKWSKLAYNILHHPAFYISDLITSILLMLLAFIERPSLATEFQVFNPSQMRIMVVIHSVLEILFLSILAVDIVLRLVWLRPLHFIRHKRTVFISVVLVVMYAEAITVLIRQENHFRITRSLRPLFFIDTYLMWGVRRVLRHIFLCFKPILDILILLLFTVVFFSLIGYFEFADVDPTYFDSFAKTYVSLFITLTTANHPDVMMEAYFRRPAAPIFFILFLIITLYFITNILLAVVYSSFSKADKNKFRKLFLHKREALRRAYDVLADHDGIKFHDFLLFMQQYKPRIPEWQVMCIFKALHCNPKEQHKEISLEEFYSFYEMIDFKWKRVAADGEDISLYACFPRGVKAVLKAVKTLVKWSWFNRLINFIVLANTVFLVVYALSIPQSNQRYEMMRKVLPVSFVFVGIYCVEIILRIIGYGPLNYFRKFWHVVDFLVVAVSLITLALETDPNYAFLVVVRPIKLIRLLRLKRHYRDIVHNMVLLAPRLISIGCVILVIYYSFAIIGMEFFQFDVYEGCCNNSWYGVGIYFSGNETGDDTANVYYLNNFNNILRSYVTLFILMVVNNWYIIMEGFASAFQRLGTDGLARIYFMAFYVVTLLVLQVVIAFIVEAFVFRIEAAEKKRHCDKHPSSSYCECMEASNRKKRVEVALQEPDMNKLKYEMTYMSETRQSKGFNYFIRRLKRVDLDHSPGGLMYHGQRLTTKDDIYLLMYRAELKNWIEDQERELQEGPRQLPRQPWWRWLWNKVKQVLEYIFE